MCVDFLGGLGGFEYGGELWLIDCGYYVGCVYCIGFYFDFQDCGVGVDEVDDVVGGDDVVCYDWQIQVEIGDGVQCLQYVFLVVVCGVDDQDVDIGCCQCFGFCGDIVVDVDGCCDCEVIIGIYCWCVECGLEGVVGVEGVDEVIMVYDCYYFDVCVGDDVECVVF